MNFREVLHACDDPAIGESVADAVDKLLAEKLSMLQKNSSERSIAAELAWLLKPYFPELDITVEYNRMGQVPKQVTWKEEPDLVYPDIIVHVLGTNKNVLVIELKKDSNPEPKGDDILKLQAYRRELGYHQALFLRLGVGATAGSVSECEWVHV